MSIEHKLATQTSSKKCLSYGCFLFGICDHIGIGKIYNKHTFKRMGFSRNEKGMLVRGGQEDDDESDQEEEEEEEEEGKIKGDEVSSKRKRRRQLRRCRFPGKKKGVSKQKMHKRSLKDDLQRNKNCSRLQEFMKMKMIKLKTLKTRRMVGESFIRSNFVEKLSLKN
ncbi:hypothetical protein M9H77_26369 [Catharanthus roseus]|uniref:Uncharacterized protein n=1 Tax=Catharanthus roseus TaxID=4058 RepID=A0ACC0AAG6_CATRO|nr:hypothetical protein M9H77_26369 [Catharanthus roseus]